MRRRISDVLMGVFWIGIGVAVALVAFGVWDFSLSELLSSWWPMFIIVPCFFSVIRNGFEGGSLIGLVIGSLLLMNTLDIVNGTLIRKMIIPIILIVIGMSIILRSIFSGSRRDRINSLGENAPEFVATFATQYFSFPGQPFFGGKVDAVFGTVQLDLSSSVITKDTVIYASSVFGSIRVKLPENVRVKTSSTSLFGGVDARRKRVEGELPTVYVDGTCIFGGVTIL